MKVGLATLVGGGLGATVLKLFWGDNGSKFTVLFRNHWGFNKFFCDGSLVGFSSITALSDC